MSSKLDFEQKQQRLKTHKRRATLLLVAMALVMLASAKGRAHWPLLGYVTAFAEAALVGGLADWFAVTALFRRPLNLPIPHTAIIPRNKARIADSLGEFIEAHFLSPERVMQRVTIFNPAQKLAAWLQQPEHARNAADQIARFVEFLLGSLTEPAIQARLREIFRRQLGAIDLSAPAGEVLGFVRSSGQHQLLLDGVLAHLAAELDKPALQQHLAELIAAEFDYLKWLSLDDAGGRYLARKLVHAAGVEVEAMRNQPHHALRRHFDEALVDLQNRLRDDPALQAQIREAQIRMLAEPAFGNALDSIWISAVSWLGRSLAEPDSLLRQKLASALAHFGQQLESEESIAEWLNRQARVAAGLLVKRYRKAVGEFIAEQLKAWDDAVMVERLEVNVGVDLQFVRLNGTLVGGLIGVLLYSLHQLVM